ncbi:hypothetical protein AMAG_07102 [Allomyces macrogynus ATCC 38327]|uniref:Uncharacterized protein n=1 Tax=Allomyces macrogynus (strain ATCC 38327) TaxID=578462 RepID=A0A0L0SHH3_ALLM3|nr:hypothetical protein AMAG_07102 [Allomyces macrogynus ATCC 38327]|eukprot:KNE61825.1 hypothetical protein AMAG_07102 [Allomyces macrogynus ATCC 38327]
MPLLPAHHFAATNGAAAVPPSNAAAALPPAPAASHGQLNLAAAPQLAPTTAPSVVPVPSEETRNSHRLSRSQSRSRSRSPPRSKRSRSPKSRPRSRSRSRRDCRDIKSLPSRRRSRSRSPRSWPRSRSRSRSSGMLRPLVREAHHRRVVRTANILALPVPVEIPLPTRAPAAVSSSTVARARDFSPNPAGLGAADDALVPRHQRPLLGSWPWRESSRVPVRVARCPRRVSARIDFEDGYHGPGADAIGRSSACRRPRLEPQRIHCRWPASSPWIPCPSRLRRKWARERTHWRFTWSSLTPRSRRSVPTT